MTLPALSGDTAEPKKFWFQKDSLAAWVLVAAVGALLFFGWGVISSFVVTALTNALYTIWLVAGVVLSIGILTSKRVRILGRLVSRWLTNLFIPIFPLEILEDRVSQARKRNDTVKDMINTVSGKVRILKDTIRENENFAHQQMDQAHYAQGKVSGLKDKTQQLQYALNANTSLNKAARRAAANKDYQIMLDRVQRIYDFLVKFSLYLDSFIDDATDEVKQARLKHDTISAAATAFRSALSILKGDATEEEIYGQAKQYLSDEYSQKSGEIENGMRIASTFITKMDIENGAINAEALAELDKYEQKLLSAGTTETVPTAVVDNREQVLVPVDRTTTPNEFGEFFK